MSAQLEIADVSKSFGGVQAVGRVSLEVRRGEILSVIGPNGAGKTTLLNMISGFYHPDSGRIALEGSDVTHDAPSHLAELGIAPNRVTRWDRGVDVSRFSPARRVAGLYPGQLNVLYAGRITRAIASTIRFQRDSSDANIFFPLAVSL